MRKKSLSIHLLQIPSYFGKPLKTLKLLQNRLKGHSVTAGDWLVLPEMWTSLFSDQDDPIQNEETAQCLQWLQAWSEQHRVTFVGSIPKISQGSTYNAIHIIQAGRPITYPYRKIHLFQLAKEHRRFKAGRRLGLVNTPWGKLGLAICFDLRFPEQFSRMAQRGAKWIILPSAWPLERIDHFSSLAKARAIENQCFIIAVNKCGKEKDGMVFGGHSVVFDPWGKKLGELSRATGILKLQLDLQESDRIRKAYPFLKLRQ